MKTNIQRALATVLNIQVVQTQRADATAQIEVEAYVMRRHGVELLLGYCDAVTLPQAIWKALENADLQGDCDYALFPITSGRAEFYMVIEGEMLRQEDALRQPMFELMGDDPRTMIMQIMELLRECSKSLVAPQLLQVGMLRVACVVLASLQWLDRWITSIRLEQAAKKVVSFQPKPQKAAPPPLFGAEGVQGKDVRIMLHGGDMTTSESQVPVPSDEPEPRNAQQAEQDGPSENTP